MGNWNISIRGVGPHHNAQPFDAEQLAAELVDKLKAAGHRVVSAEVTYGGVEVLEDGRYGGEPNGQARSLLRIGQALRLVVMLLLAGLVLLAGSVHAAELVTLAAGEAIPADPAAPTVLGSVLTWLAVGVLSAVVALFGVLGVYLRGRAKESTAWAVVNSLWVLMQTAVAHAERELRPEIAKALADGKLTKEEAQALKAKTLELFKGMAGDRIAELAKLLRLTDSGVGVFLSGLLERAVTFTKASTPATPVGVTGSPAAPSVPPSP